MEPQRGLYGSKETKIKLAPSLPVFMLHVRDQNVLLFVLQLGVKHTLVQYNLLLKQSAV